ncbi:MAG: ROK family protein [Pseudomonadota bacterium]
MSVSLFGGIEAGGTKIRCATAQLISNPAGLKLAVVRDITIPTDSPAETLPRILAFFAGSNLAGLGVAAFGPVDVQAGSKDYGLVLDTPKLAWQRFHWLDALASLRVPVVVDTDVQCAAAAERNLRPECDSLAYVTVGTGIGLGLSTQPQVPMLSHPEFGHILVRRRADDNLPGMCPFHQDCLEGLASGPAFAARAAAVALNEETGEESDEQTLVEIEADYLAQGCINLLRIAPVRTLVLGGGVMQTPALFKAVQQRVQVLSGGYAEFDVPLSQRLERALLDPDAGLIGALNMAADAELSGLV